LEIHIFLDLSGLLPLSLHRSLSAHRTIRSTPPIAAMDVEYDVVVLGTGLKECILSGLLSVDRLKVRAAPASSPPVLCKNILVVSSSLAHLIRCFLLRFMLLSTTMMVG